MNRRTALLMTLLMGGLAAPRRALAQARGRVAAAAPAESPRFSRRREEVDDPLAADTDLGSGPADATPPADFPSEPGRQWRDYDITAYTGLPHSQDNTNPQTSIIEWIFRRTGSSAWHSDRIAVLCANRSQLRAYHTPKMLQQVGEMVDRFVDTQDRDVLSVRVRFVAAADPTWRYTVHSRLNLVETGPQGQQIWALRAEDAALVLNQIQINQGYKPISSGYKLLADQKVEMINGQTLTVETTDTRNYIAGLQRESAAGLGLQPGIQPLKEGIVLRLSPLLTYEGDAVEAALDLRVNTVRYLHRTKVMVHREVGPGEMTLDVPEVSESRLNRTVPPWPLGQTLLISAGIHPGILQSKSGLFNLRLPGTVPTTTELLVFIDVETSSAPVSRAAPAPAPASTRRRSSRDEG